MHDLKTFQVQGTLEVIYLVRLKASLTHAILSLNASSNGPLIISGRILLIL